MARQNLCLTIVGVIGVLFGIAVLVLGLYVTPKELPNVFKERVNAYVVVDSEVCLHNTNSHEYTHSQPLRMQKDTKAGLAKAMLIIHIIWYESTRICCISTNNCRRLYTCST